MNVGLLDCLCSTNTCLLNLYYFYFTRVEITVMPLLKVYLRFCFLMVKAICAVRGA